MAPKRPRLPTLAPRLPGNAAPAVDRPSVKEHTEAEWLSRKDLIESLYISDNRKLNETMAIMESKYGFAATEQMYKKRFKKWNIRKRAYRKSSVADSSSSSSSPPRSSSSSPGDSSDGRADEEADALAMTMTTKAALVRTCPRPQLVQLKAYAKLENILGSVFCWTQDKLTTHRAASDPMSKYLANPNRPPMQDSRTMYRIFELLFDLWARGQGDLAGMAARKGFFVLEFVLTDDHPDLVWHLLDTIYDMVDRGHLQLLDMFLRHATVLASAQFAPNHPILLILQQLIGCDTRTEEGRQYICQLLRRAWLRNVDLLAEHVGSVSAQDLWVYEQLIWDGRTRLRRDCGLEKKQVMFEALQGLADQRRRRSPDLHGVVHDVTEARMEGVEHGVPHVAEHGFFHVAEHGMHHVPNHGVFHVTEQSMEGANPTPTWGSAQWSEEDEEEEEEEEEDEEEEEAAVGSGEEEEEYGAPADLDSEDGDEEDCIGLRIDALALEFTQMDIGDKAKAEQLATALLQRTGSGSGSRSNARFHAYARKMLARLYETKQDYEHAEDNLIWAVRKREDAHGTGANLRVIRDMWVLSGYYERVGRTEMAAQTTHDALVRAKSYLEDLPG